MSLLVLIFIGSVVCFTHSHSISTKYTVHNYASLHECETWSLALRMKVHGGSDKIFWG